MQNKKRKTSFVPKVSVVVPTYNLKDILLECLNSVFSQNYPNLEVIVVDNGSTDGTSKEVKKKFSKVKLIRNKKNLGVTGGVNTGLKEVSGDYVWLVDHDNIFKPNTLLELVKLAESDKKIGIVVPKIFYWEDQKIIWAAGTGMNLLTGENIFRGGEDKGQYEKIEEVDIAPANFLVRKEVIDKIGGYDDIFFISYEDADFSFRVRKAGYKIVYTPNAICYHKIPFLDKMTAKKRWLLRAYWAARNKIIFMRKHSPFFSFFVLLYPVWFLIYTYQAIRYSNIETLLNFYRGIKDGFKWAIFEYEN